jgi:hypothetical protein
MSTPMLFWRTSSEEITSFDPQWKYVAFRSCVRSQCLSSWSSRFSDRCQCEDSSIHQAYALYFLLRRCPTSVRVKGMHSSLHVSMPLRHCKPQDIWTNRHFHFSFIRISAELSFGNIRDGHHRWVHCSGVFSPPVDRSLNVNALAANREASCAARCSAARCAARSTGVPSA